MLTENHMINFEASTAQAQPEVLIGDRSPSHDEWSPESAPLRQRANELLDELRAVLAQLSNGDNEQALTEREKQVVRCIADGLSTKEVAAQLGLSIKTVETHRRNVMEKTGITSIAELTKYAIRHGMTSI
jgi:DNA-binding NarL/FixJ family response regulator